MAKLRTTQISATDENRFWMICINGCKGSRKRHDNFTSAYAEAAKIAKCNQGKEIAILESVGSVIIGDPLSSKDLQIASLQQCKAALEKMITHLSADELKGQ